MEKENLVFYAIKIKVTSNIYIVVDYQFILFAFKIYKNKILTCALNAINQ